MLCTFHAWPIRVCIFMLSTKRLLLSQYWESEQKCLCAKILKEGENGAQSKD